MIFVTVGTHEQSFRRLIEKIDTLVCNGTIKEEVFIQTGYTKDYVPKGCKYSEMITSEEMEQYCNDARIIITHGGPGSIMLPFRLGKVPIVVPRNPQFNEHVDEHQMLFTKKLKELNKVIAIYNIEELEKSIVNYKEYSLKCNVDSSSTVKRFTEAFEKEIEELLLQKKKREK